MILVSKKIVYVPNVSSFPSLFTFPLLQLFLSASGFHCYITSLLFYVSTLSFAILLSTPCLFSHLYSWKSSPPPKSFTVSFLQYILSLPEILPTSSLTILLTALLFLSLAMSTLYKYNPNFHGKVTLLFPSFEAFFKIPPGKQPSCINKSAPND